LRLSPSSDSMRASPGEPRGSPGGCCPSLRTRRRRTSRYRTPMALQLILCNWRCYLLQSVVPMIKSDAVTNSRVGVLLRISDPASKSPFLRSASLLQDAWLGQEERSCLIAVKVDWWREKKKLADCSSCGSFQKWAGWVCFLRLKTRVRSKKQAASTSSRVLW